jgi:hypothetical protein
MENFMSSEPSHWTVAIFAARETPAVLAATVRAALVACAQQRATVDVLINGNEALATHFADLAATIPLEDCMLRIWSIAAADKAHTWNEYVHQIWEASSIAFFIDGYVLVKPEALAVINRRIASTMGPLAATGVPTSGRSANRLRMQALRGGGMHGNLYAVTSEGMDIIRNKRFRLPLGLYRNDGMLGSALACRLDPAANQQRRGTLVVEEATWDVEGISAMSYKNIVGYFKRRLRQAQGTLENRAVREHMSIKRLPPQLLPSTSREMVNNWLFDQPAQACSLFLRQPLCLYTAWQLRAARNWEKTNVAPALLRTYDNRRNVRFVA